MRKYLSFFKVRFITGLQYRAAAYAGVVTQFCWGCMTILMFRSFYQSNAEAFPMTLSELSSYLWLQQAFLALFMAWFLDNDILDGITSGNVAYELCRPIDLYTMWFLKNMAIRLSKVALRCMPIILVAAFLPKPYNISMPSSLFSAVLFVPSLLTGFLLIIAFNMLIYISVFYTLSPTGIRVLAVSAIEFLSGAIIPIPFFPESLQKFIYMLPFASMQNTPFLIYTGYIKGIDAIKGMLLQVVWFLLLAIAGKMFMKKALKKAVVQGG